MVKATTLAVLRQRWLMCDRIHSAFLRDPESEDSAGAEIGGAQLSGFGLLIGS